MQFAMLFPGQGSQSIGMLSELAQEFPIVEKTFDEASAALEYDMWRLTQQGPEEKLNRTEYTQPALLAAGVAAWRAWQSAGGSQPCAMAGHSLGEYTALTCAGALRYADALRLVAERGRLMQAAVTEGEGAMAAIVGLPDTEVETLCRNASQGEVLEAVNFNAPGQVVIAGAHSAVERALGQAKAAGAKLARALAVSVPAHSSLMRPAAQRLREVLQTVELQTPTIPVIHNVDAKPRATAGDIREALIAQLHSPVRWVESVRHLLASNANPMFECGPGRVLTGLSKRIDKAIDALALGTPSALRKAVDRTCAGHGNQP